MKKALIIDTSILCVHLEVLGKDTCGTDNDHWDKKRVDKLLKQEEKESTTFVLPLATILETGNHIAQASSKRYEIAQALAEIISAAANEKTPWAAFTDQTVLWDAGSLRKLADDWPTLAAQKLSIGDATIKFVAEHYAKMGVRVEILTGDNGLKAYEPITPVRTPRRRRS